MELRPTNPFDQMIDAVVSCTRCGAPGIGTCACWDELPLLPPATMQAMARGLALQVLDHIDTMYPAMWEGVPKMARTSVRNTIIRETITMLKTITREP